jgi:hypothetical protein
MGAVNDGPPLAFPSVKAPNLEGKMVSLPEDFSGDLNLVLVAFDRDQQADVDTWIKAAPELFKGYPGIPIYEIPTLGKEYRLARFIIDRGMKSGIPDAERRAHTISLYIDKRPFEQALQIHDENRITVLLVNKKGNAVWREEGMYYEIKGNALRGALAKLLGEPKK